MSSSKKPTTHASNNKNKEQAATLSFNDAVTLIQENLIFNGRLPSSNHSEPRLYNVLCLYRHRFKKKLFHEEKIQILQSIHPDILSHKKLNGIVYPPTELPKWKSILQHFQSLPIDPYIDTFRFCHPHVMKYVNGSARTFAEYMLLKIKLHYINPNSCSYLSHYGTLSRIISFMLPTTADDQPLWRFLSSIPTFPTESINVKSSHLQKHEYHICSTYFGPDKIPTPMKHVMINTLNHVYPEHLMNALSACEEKDEVVQIIKSNTKYFDTFHYGKKGRYSNAKDIRPIVDLGLPQPRRTSFSCTRRASIPVPAFKTSVNELFVYGAAGRPYLDARCRPMPPHVAHLGEEAWKLCWRYLSPLSKQCPPYHCQVCMYNSKMESKMQLHKDNGYQKGTGSLGGTTAPSDMNSHIFGTDVIVVTMGSAMEFHLVPPPDGEDHRAPQKNFMKSKKSGRSEIISLAPYSVYVHSAHDDELYMHGLQFSKDDEKCDMNKTRVAFIFRWLCVSMMYRANAQDDDSNRYSTLEKKSFDQIEKGFKKTGHAWKALLKVSEEQRNILCNDV